MPTIVVITILKLILNITLKLDAPSIFAASDNELGTDSKQPTSTKKYVPPLCEQGVF